jgi:hypothetical protein
MIDGAIEVEAKHKEIPNAPLTLYHYVWSFAAVM